DSRARCPRGLNRALEHGEYELVPVAIAGWVHRMHDQRRAPGGINHRSGVQGVALDPGDGRLVPGRRFRLMGLARIPMKGGYTPAAAAECGGQLTPDAAGHT